MIKLDNNIAHDIRVLRDNPSGLFCGSPVVSLDEIGMDADVAADQTLRLKFSSGTSIPPEILPGEERCVDGIIRRTTTAEVIGYDTYHNQEATEAGTRRVIIVEAQQASKDGKLIMWRPNKFVGEGEYALVAEEKGESE